MEKAICFSARGLPGISLQLSQILHLVEKHTFFETHVSDFFILKMFIGRRKSIIESEESSDDEVVSFRRKVINRISSSPDSDTEESYASEDLDGMLEELAIDEEEELNSVDDSLDNIQWNKFTNRQQ